MKRPNILFVICHDLGDYLGCYGTPVPTPNLDRLAAQGVVLENHFSTDPVCSPSRGSILTGCYQHTHGLMGLVHRGWELNVDKCPTLPALLRAAGYETHLFGIQHEHWDASRLGYDHIHKAKNIFADSITPVVLDWLQSRKEGDRPFFASIGFFETHRLNNHFKRDVYEPARPEDVQVPPFLPDIPVQRQELAEFYGSIKLVDREVGKLLSLLEETGLAENTLVIFTTDHGASFLHSKATLYDGGTKVAALLRWPGVLPAGRRVATVTSHVDLLPSLLKWLDLPIPAGVEGKSFVSLAEGRAEEGREYVFAEKNYTNYYDPSRMVRSRTFKYIRKGLRTCMFDFVIPEIEGAATTFLGNDEIFQFYSSRRCTEELYDLARDPGEMRNIADDPQYLSTLNKLRSALDAHLEATNDPFRFLRNELPMPECVYSAVRPLKKK